MVNNIFLLVGFFCLLLFMLFVEGFVVVMIFVVVFVLSVLGIYDEKLLEIFGV